MFVMNWILLKASAGSRTNNTCLVLEVFVQTCGEIYDDKFVM